MMLRALRFTLPLLAVVAALSVVASVGLELATRRWFEKDVALRADLAVAGAREALAQRLQEKDRGALKRLLANLTRSGRMLAAAACSADGSVSVATEGYPAELGCRALAPEVRSPDGSGAARWRTATRIDSRAGGRVHVRAVPVLDAADDAAVGVAVLVQDLSFADRREALAQRALFALAGLVAAAALIVSIAASRSAFRRWSAELCGLLRANAGEQRPEYQPVLKVVRALASRLAAEERTASEQDGGDGGAPAWNPRRLKRVLTRDLHGDKVIVLANREPYVHTRGEDGAIRVEHPAGGLVTALEPVMRACSGVWIAHGSGSADRETVDRHDRVLVPPGEGAYALRRVWLTAEEEKGYYHGLANEGLWPLCHIAHARPIFRSEDWAQYTRVNRRFAEAVCAEVGSDDDEDPIVLVQDYHFALAPRMIRERLPRATIITTWHIPWPNAERFGICPWARELLDGLAGSSILGFHTQLHCNNFLDAFDRFMEARIDREQQAVVQAGRASLVRAYPISIEWPNRWASASPPVAECRRSVFAELGLTRDDALLGIGIDRLDYTKGIEERLLAVERLLERAPQLRGRFSFAQLGAPSRTAIPRYRELNETLERLAARINERFGDGDGYRPVVLLRANHDPATVFRYYRAADVCYVSSLHDGMNLVAKEYLAAREDEQGVLLLSHFTGAARELTEALIVNPYDLDEASAALETALTMSAAEQRERMRALRAVVAENNVYRWAGRMLAEAGRLRDRDRLCSRLTRVPKAA